MVLLDFLLFSPANLVTNRIAPACLQQPKDGFLGPFTVQGMGEVDKKGTEPKELMEITNIKVRQTILKTSNEKCSGSCCGDARRIEKFSREVKCVLGPGS